MDECKYFFNQLVYVDFGDNMDKIIGKVQSHRITEEGRIMYNIPLTGVYAPVTMVHKLTTKEQESEYYRLVEKWQGRGTKADFIKDMQNIFMEIK